MEIHGDRGGSRLNGEVYNREKLKESISMVTVGEGGDFRGSAQWA